MAFAFTFQQDFDNNNSIGFSILVVLFVGYTHVNEALH